MVSMAIPQAQLASEIDKLRKFLLLIEIPTAHQSLLLKLYKSRTIEFVGH